MSVPSLNGHQMSRLEVLPSTTGQRFNYAHITKQKQGVTIIYLLYRVLPCVCFRVFPVKESHPRIGEKSLLRIFVYFFSIHVEIPISKVDVLENDKYKHKLYNISKK